MESQMIRCRSLLPVLAGSLMLGGCAHSWIDTSGNRRVMGWVDLTLPPPTTVGGADWTRVRTIGLALSRSEGGAEITVGYSDNTLAIIRDNSCVAIHPLMFPPTTP